MPRKTCVCVGCGAVVPVGEVSIDPFDDLIVVCADCERERVEEEEREAEEREASEVSRAVPRWMWD